MFTFLKIQLLLWRISNICNIGRTVSSQSHCSCTLHPASKTISYLTTRTVSSRASQPQLDWHFGLDNCYVCPAHIQDKVWPTQLVIVYWVAFGLRHFITYIVKEMWSTVPASCNPSPTYQKEQHWNKRGQVALIPTAEEPSRVGN